MVNERLGRGLSALIPESEKSPAASSGIGTLAIERIKPNRFQPRKHFDMEALEELAASIKANGIIQPLIVTKSVDRDYELIAGERRLEAAKLAGLDSVPVVIRSVSEKEQFLFAIIENIQREDLSPIEEALAYQSLSEEHGLTHQEIASVMGKDRATITNSLRLLKLPENVLQLLAEGEISPGHARAILSVESEYQLAFAEFIIKYKLTVRQAESKSKVFVQELQKPAERQAKSSLSRSLEQDLSRLFRLKVSVKEHKGKGKITLEYQSPEELEALTKLLEKLK
ncbi:MAG: ParB/RepB/Spo0J family partition protein [Candidatus Cloacimonetes bacterium]|nr:ParB/RepB/Spo0J family partition protein [Candidatus Cloacimonadota bacterium]